MPVTPTESRDRRFIDHIRAGLGELPKLPSQQDIRVAALALFTRQLDAKLKNLQDGEAIQITYRIDIVGQNGKIRGGSGSERNMPEYLEWRKAVYSRDAFTCKECGSKKRLNAHHIKPWHAHRDLRFTVSNGITLCGDCHAKKHPHLNFTKKHGN